MKDEREKASHPSSCCYAAAQINRPNTKKAVTQIGRSTGNRETQPRLIKPHRYELYANSKRRSSRVELRDAHRTRTREADRIAAASSMMRIKSILNQMHQPGITGLMMRISGRNQRNSFRSTRVPIGYWSQPIKWTN